MTKRPSLESRIAAIVSRDAGNPYPNVLDDFCISSNQFYFSVKRMDELQLGATSRQQNVLIALQHDDLRKQELFNMGEVFVRDNYFKLMGLIPGEAMKLYGLYSHPNNVETIIYAALTSYHPDLASERRSEVIEAIRNLPYTLSTHMDIIGLGAVMQNAFRKEESDSPHKVLQVFDEIFQARTGEPSLFDISQPSHLHPWGDCHKASARYWKDMRNVKVAIYHVLTESNPLLASLERDVVLDGMKQLPLPLGNYVNSLGLASLIDNPLSGTFWSLHKFMQAFDEEYVEKSKQPSLFDKTQHRYMQIDTQGLVVR